jgi:hypothetical protein
VGNPRTYRAPWYTQTDFNFQQNYKIGEQKVVSFTATFANILNQRAVTAYQGQVDSNATQSYITPGGTFIAQPGFYANAERPYSVSSLLNQDNFGGTGFGNTINSQYGKPYLFQAPRNFRLGVKFSF